MILGGHGFLDLAGTFTTINFDVNTSATGINGAGQIVGSGGGNRVAGGFFVPPRGFLDTAGTLTSVDFPGATYATPSGINGSGQIVGSYGFGGGKILGPPPPTASWTLLGHSRPSTSRGAPSTSANGINGSGQIVGGYSDGSGGHGFLDTAGIFATIDIPGATSTSANGINGSGQIVGGYSDGSGGHGFLDTAGTFTTIDAPGATSTFASSINGSGLIVGSYTDASNSLHGFLATPIAGGVGDPHLTTYDGHDYDLQAVGDFLLTRSTVSGDSFNVQVRTRSWYDGAAVTVISEVAAKLGTDRVTFGLDRASSGASFVWVDGRSTSLSAGSPVLVLDGGRIVQLSPTEYQVIWDTGEILDVANAGSYLNVTFPHWANLSPGSVEGLLGTDTGWNSDFHLADGTLLDAQLSLNDIDGMFANSWRVADAASLLDPSAVPEPSAVTLLGVSIGLTGLAYYAAARWLALTASGRHRPRCSGR